MVEVHDRRVDRGQLYMARVAQHEAGLDGQQHHVTDEV